MLNVFKQNEYHKLDDHFVEPIEITKVLCSRKSEFYAEIIVDFCLPFEMQK